MHALIAAVLACAAWSAPDDIFVARLGELEREVVKTRSLAAVKSFLRSEEKRLRSGNSEKTRSLRLTVAGLLVYLELIDETRFSKDRCKDYERAIRAHATSTGRANSEMPGEAEEALKFLKLLC